MQTVFVSSTFRDMQRERDILHLVVLPAVNDFARQYRRRLELIDLRWGVNTQDMESGDGADKVLRVCLSEIDRCKPYMIVLLGDRYGWVPPSGLMEPYATGENALLENADKSITELEIKYGALADETNLSQCLFYFRKTLPYIRMSPEQRDVYVSTNQADALRMHQLKESIRAVAPVHEYEAEWDEEKGDIVGLGDFADRVTNDLIKLLKEAWGNPDDVTETQALHLDFVVDCSIRAEQYEVRAGFLDAFDAFLSSKETRFFAITGEEGTGKSMLFDYLEFLSTKIDDVFFVPFVCGYNRKCSDAASMQEHFIRFMLELMDQDEVYDLKTIQLEERRSLLSTLAFSFVTGTDYDLIFGIDDLDMLNEDELRDSLDWLPKEFMSDRIKLVLTCSDDFFQRSAFCTHPNLTRFRVKPLETDEIDGIIRNIMQHNHKENLPQAVIKAIHNRPASGNALYLSMMLQRFAMMDKSDFDLIESDRERASKDVGEDGQAAIIRYMIGLVNEMPDSVDELAKELVSLAGQRINPDLAADIFDYLAVSRSGLRVSDLREIILENGGFWNPSDFALLTRYLAPFIRETSNLKLRFSHNCFLEGQLKTVQNIDELNRNILKRLAKLPPGDDFRLTELVHYACLCHDGTLLYTFFSDICPVRSGEHEEEFEYARMEAVEDFLATNGQTNWLLGEAASWGSDPESYTAVIDFLLCVAVPYARNKANPDELKMLAALLQAVGKAMPQEFRSEWHRFQTASVSFALSQTYALLGEHERALTVALYAEELLSFFGDNTNFFPYLAAVQLQLGHCCLRLSDYPGACAAYMQSHDIWQELEYGLIDPADCVKVRIMNGTAKALCGRGTAEMARSRTDAIVYYEKALEIYANLENDDLDFASALELCETVLQLAIAYFESGDAQHAKAKASFGVMRINNLKHFGSSFRVKTLEIDLLTLIGDCEFVAGDAYPAMLFYTEAIQKLEIVTKETRRPSHLSRLAILYTKLARDAEGSSFSVEQCKELAAGIWKQLYDDTGDVHYLALYEHEDTLKAAILTTTRLDEPKPKTEPDDRPDYLLQSFDRMKEIACKLGYYDILVNDDEEVLICIPGPQVGNAEEAVFYFGGGEHGILFLGPDCMIICDFVHPGVRELLSAVGKVLITEMNKDRQVEREYKVPLQIRRQTSKLAGKLMKFL